MNRRTFLKRICGSFLALLGIGGGTYYYAHDIEPKMLDIKHESLKSNKIPKSFHNMKIIQFTDTHIGYQYTLSQFAELVEIVNKQNPDIILFTGDLVDHPNDYNWNNNLVELLQKMEAASGKYWIYGNHDHGGYGSDIVKKVMDRGGFKLLKNDHTKISINHEQILLAGVDDIILGKPDLNRALEGADSKLFTILMAHEPDYADNTVDYPVDVQLSGHSHGGQVRLPFFGHLYTPSYAHKYVDGKYVLADDRLTLYVSKGIGTTRLPYRFLCKPEIKSYTLKSSE